MSKRETYLLMIIAALLGLLVGLYLRDLLRPQPSPGPSGPKPGDDDRPPKGRFYQDGEERDGADITLLKKAAGQ